MHQIEAYRQALSDQAWVEITLTEADHAPGLVPGGRVWAQECGMAKIVAGDYVLCREGADAHVRQVFRTRLLHGVPCLEVLLGEQSIVSRFVREGNYLGRVSLSAPPPPPPAQEPPTEPRPGFFGACRKLLTSLVGNQT